MPDEAERKETKMIKKIVRFTEEQYTTLMYALTMQKVSEECEAMTQREDAKNPCFYKEIQDRSTKLAEKAEERAYRIGELINHIENNI